MALKDLIVRGPVPPEAKPPFPHSGRGPPKKKPLVATPSTLEPQHIDNETWFYEDRKGLLIVHEIRDHDGQYIRTDQFTIPWKLVRSSVRRCIPDFYR